MTNKLKNIEYVTSPFKNFNVLNNGGVIRSVLDITKTGYVAGGCFKNLFNGEPVKDIDVFFESESDWEDAVENFNDIIDNSTNLRKWRFKYRNDNAVAFQREGCSWFVELICSVFGEPETVIRSFDFTLTKFAVYDSDIDEFEGDSLRCMYHPMFFEHLHLKRLVADESLRFPVGSFERSLRYAAYGYAPCRETKKKLIDGIRSSKESTNTMSKYLGGGID